MVREWGRLGLGIIAGLLVTFTGLAAPALAYDNPDLLPDHPTPVIDLAKILTDPQRESLESNLSKFEDETGWKLRVLTQYDRTPGQAVKSFWNLDERSLLLVADERGGNLLNFNVGEALFALMPRTYWVELQTRYGNQYYVKDHGQDAAIVDALSAVEGCLERGGCQVVPGLPREQWLLTLATSILGGLVVGFAATGFFAATFVGGLAAGDGFAGTLFAFLTFGSSAGSGFNLSVPSESCRERSMFSLSQPSSIPGVSR